MADTIREGFNRVLQRGFLGGVDNKHQADLLKDDQVVSMQNGTTLRSTLRRRGGATASSIAASSVSTQFRPVWLGPVTLQGKGERLIGLVNVTGSSSKFVTFDGSDYGVNTYPGLTQFSEEAEAITFGDRVYVLDPTATPSYWKPGNVLLREDEAGIRGMPQGVSGCFFQFRGYVLNGEFIYFSKILGNEAQNADEEQTGQTNAQPLLWHPQQAFRLSTGRGVKVLPFHNQMLVIFTARGIETFEPNNCNPLDPTMLVLTRNFGCSSKHSVVTCGEDIYFADLDGHIRSLKQSVTDEAQGVVDKPVSEPITDVINRVNPDRLRAIRACFIGGYYIVGFPVDASRHASEFWAFDINDRAWIGPWSFKDNGVTPALQFPGLAAARLPLDGRQRLYAFGKDASGNARLYKLLQGRDDDSTSQTFRVVTRAYDAGMPDLEKEWQHAEMRFRFLDSAADASVTVAVRARVDEGAWTNMASLTFTPDATPVLNDTGSTPVLDDSGSPPVLRGYGDQVAKVQLTGLGRGRTLQLEFTITEQASTFEILGINATGLTNNVRMGV